MNYTYNSREQQLLNRLQHYEKKNTDLQLLTGINLDQLLEVARVCTLYVDINGKKTFLSTVADAMKKTGLSFEEIYYTLFNRIVSAKQVDFSFKEVLNRLSVEWKKL